ncbi:MAG: endopeptidase La [Chloroflexota bacterium]|nr:endopeptidase La [Chloroflexota bacterium]
MSDTTVLPEVPRTPAEVGEDSANRKSSDADSGPIEVDLPVLPLRGETLFPIPDTVNSFVVGREQSLAAIEEALSLDRRVLALSQHDPDAETVTFSDLHEVGTEAKIARVLKLPDGSTSVLAEGIRRVRAVTPVSEHPFVRAMGWVVEELDEAPAEARELMPLTLELFQHVVELNEATPDEAFIRAMNAETPGLLADIVAASLNLVPGTQQELLEIREVSERLRLVHTVLEEEIRVLELERQLRDDVREEVDKDQREFILREQLRTITKELGETNAQNTEISEFREKLEAGRYPEAVIERGLKEIDRLNAMPPGSPEASMVRNYLEWLIELPWKKRTRDNTDIRRAARILDTHHHGLDRVKERLLEYIAVRRLARQSRSPILCFVGPPGVGKTSLGQSIAEALSRKFVRVSLGGVRDEAEIRGHRMTYIGSMPGRILQMMRQAGTVNPVFMIDELDKLGVDFRGDPSAALLEVLDPEQNSAFSDHYLELPYDLSRVIFIATANSLEGLPPALIDRMEVVELPGYVEDEKLAIAQRFLVPRELDEHGLDAEAVQFKRGALTRIIREYTREAGVRGLTRSIAAVARKRALASAEGSDSGWNVRARDLPKVLGPPRFRFGSTESESSIGAAMAVFSTPAGGDLSPVEVSLARGTGEILLTGLLGSVMKESAHAALTYARACADGSPSDRRNFAELDVHVHVPSGALPKDGPSAGLAVVVALQSALTDTKVRHDLTLTGEITLQGRVLPVGSIKPKVLGAHRAGVRVFVLPQGNRQDLAELPAHVREDMEFIEVACVGEALQSALIDEK